jgi:hypothetical protein
VLQLASVVRIGVKTHPVLSGRRRWRTACHLPHWRRRRRFLVSFLKTLLLHRCSPSPTTPLELSPASSMSVLFCHAAGCWEGAQLRLLCLMCSIAMGYPAALDLADIATSGCFATIGPLSGRCFATECVQARFLADALPPWFLADDLPPCRSVCWRMLCLRGRLVRWRMLCRCC